MIGLVRKSTGSSYELWDENFNVLSSKIKGKFKLDGIKSTNPIAVGDKVEFSFDEQHDIAVIEKLFPRKNYIVRKSNNLSKQTHIIASNIDLMVIVATLAFPRTSQGFIDRLLVTAEAYGIESLIVFNKTDIHTPENDNLLKEFIKMYEDIGYTCIEASALNGQGLIDINQKISKKITLITGHSGVGKSTLLNKLNPELQLKSNIVSKHSKKGKHTTTFAEMFKMAPDTFVIDSPGIKEFGLVDINASELSHYFPEIAALNGTCKFKNCIHVNEPGCSVIKAVEERKIHPSRYNSYLSILRNDDSHR